ncbi:Uncharacterised protein [uncultured archaeon]|nr:Uncharacterised protein [uncultured archaeon]
MLLGTSSNVIMFGITILKNGASSTKFKSNLTVAVAFKLPESTAVTLKILVPVKLYSGTITILLFELVITKPTFKVGVTL